MYKKIVSGFSFVVAALLVSLLYSEGCSIGGGLMNFCLFEGRGFPLPYYNLGKIDWTILLADFVFFGLVFIIIYIFIILSKKLLKIMGEKTP